MSVRTFPRSAFLRESPIRRAPAVANASARRGPRPPIVRQQSFDDLGVPLRHVTFCVVDLETTGTSPTACEITEVGAAKFIGGRCIGTFQTLVNPGVPIPPEIVYLTGITENMVGPAPTITKVNKARRFSSSFSRSARSNALKTRLRISVASSKVFSPGANCSH